MDPIALKAAPPQADPTDLLIAEVDTMRKAAQEQVAWWQALVTQREKQLAVLKSTQAVAVPSKPGRENGATDIRDFA